jgi:hypothetical protein
MVSRRWILEELMWPHRMEAGQDMAQTEDYTEENVVDITIVVTGKAQVVVNGTTVNEDEEESENKVTMTMSREGDVLVSINGEDFLVEEHK